MSECEELHDCSDNWCGECVVDTLPGVDRYAEELHKAMFIEPPNTEER